ncbi:MAG: hypothetical protein ABI165_03705, partial [Bryobacteraceae bacterium]
MPSPFVDHGRRISGSEPFSADSALTGSAAFGAAARGPASGFISVVAVIKPAERFDCVTIEAG